MTLSRVRAPDRIRDLVEIEDGDCTVLERGTVNTDLGDATEAGRMIVDVSVAPHDEDTFVHPRAEPETEPVNGDGNGDGDGDLAP